MSTLVEVHNTVNKCIESVVLANTYILAWVMLGATLTNDNVACLYNLTTEVLQTESF